jgi:hypothetical protein
MANAKRVYQVVGHKLVWTYRHPSGGMSTGESEHSSYSAALSALQSFTPDPKLSLLGLAIRAVEEESVEE